MKGYLKVVVLIALMAIRSCAGTPVFASGPLGLDELTLSLTSSSRFEESGVSEKEARLGDLRYTSSLDTKYDEVVAADNLFNSASECNKSYAGFISAAKEGSEDFTELQKIAFLEQVSYMVALASNINGTYVNIPAEDMYQGMTDGTYTTGQCGNGATFVANVAMDAFGWSSDKIWLQSGASKDGLHVFNGIFYTDESGYSQIIWLDQGAAIATGTTSYKNAIAFREMSNGEIPLFQQWVGVPGAVLFLVTSRAEEVTLSATGWTDTDVRLSGSLTGDKKSEGRKIRINLSSDVKEIGYSSGVFGVNYFNYKNPDDPYNSLSGLNGFRGDLNFSGEHLSFTMGISYLDYQVKNLDDSQEDYSHRALVITPAVSVTEIQAINKDWKVSYGWLMSAGGSYFFAESYSAQKMTGRIETGLGARLSYVPCDNKSFFLETQEVVEGAVNDLEDQAFRFQQKSFQTTIGGTYSLVHAEIAYADLNYGERYKTKLSLTYGRITGEAGSVSENSDWERFMPDLKEFSGSLAYGWDVSQSMAAQVKLFGTVKEEQYLDAAKTDTKSVGAEIKILWK